MNCVFLQLSLLLGHEAAPLGGNSYFRGILATVACTLHFAVVNNIDAV
jgi:hypothetical protein